MKMQIRQQSGVSILEPHGKIMGPSVSELREVLLPEIADYESPRILINFENVSMIDSSGLGVLMQAHAAATTKDGRIGAIHVGKNIKNLIILSRVVTLFEHFDSEDDAISAMSA